ncbi:MAG: glycoside hydrolase family 2 protein [Candidatus Zipacnadales bacterium]
MGDESVPRPEHPRPDWHRGTREGRDWVNLNGPWHFDFDPEEVGETEEWFVPGKHPFGDRILVPFGWESHLAWGDENQASNDNYFSKKAFLNPESVTLDNYQTARRHETGWYYRTFTVPQRWRRERVYLCCGALDYFGKVWVNGQLVWEGESGYVPFEVDITDLLVPTDLETSPLSELADPPLMNTDPSNQTVEEERQNHLVIRVHDPNDHEQQPVGKQSHWYARTSGIWQTVWLEPRSEVHIAKARFGVNIESGEITCEIWLNRPPEGEIGFRLALQMPGGGTTYHTWGANSDGGAGPYITTLLVDEPRLWSPEDPYLYPVAIELLQDVDTLDLVHTYFAFREISLKPLLGKTTRYIHLNGRPVYLRGALDQSFNPWGVYTFRSDEEIRRDIELALRAGFNFLRLHIKAEEPRFHYWADRLGLLTMVDMPNFGLEGYSSVACKRWKRMMRAIVARDQGHPSIIAWCLFNESWGLGGEAYKELPERQEWVRQMVRLAKSLDPTRPVEDNSPCHYDHVETDINSWHFYINDYTKAKEHIDQVVEETKPGSAFNYCPGFTQTREPLLNSEYGGIAARMGDLDVSWCFHFLTNELRLHEKICGYVYTQLQDIEWERNGVYNYDRTPKKFGYDLRELNGADFLALDAPPCQTVAPGQEISIPAFASHFGPFVGDHATLLWELERLDYQGQRTRLGESPGRRVPFPRFAVTPAGKITVTMPPQPGLVTLNARLQTASGDPIARNWVFFHVVDSTPPPGVIPIELHSFVGEGLHTYDVQGSPEAVWIEGAGCIRGEVTAPANVDLTRVAGLRLIGELSSCRPSGGGKQTDMDRWPSRVEVWLAGVSLGVVELPDHPADERGVLSHHYGLGGRYGELVSLEVPPQSVGTVLEALKWGAELRFEVPSDLPGGLSVYGSRTGRYPTGPYVLLGT